MPDEEKEQEKEQNKKAGGAGTAPVLNREQEYAVRCSSPYIAVKAGPGTGKTKTLV